MVLKSKNFLAVIIPMYNEEKVADKCIGKVLSFIKKEKDRIVLIAINDGSRDKTYNILERWRTKEKKYLKVVHHKTNKGYGGAIQTGIREAIRLNFEYCLTMDSDLTNDPKYIHKFIEESKKGFDVVKASRYMKGSKVVNVPDYRRVVSSIGNFVASAFFNVGITDCTNGFRMAKTSKLRGMKFKENNFSIILEEMYILKKNGSTFSQIPYTLTSRKNSASHFSYKPKVFYDYFKYAMMATFLR